MNVGIIGNGAFGGLVDRRGRIVWCCLNGFNSDPIFNSRLNNDSEDGGWFDISIENLVKSEQKYIPNTCILITTLVSSTNDVLQIKDFAPRFIQHDRIFQPYQIFRTLTRIRGDPKATIRIRPSFEYNAAEGYQTRGSHHVRYCGPTGTLRVTTNAPIQLIIDELPFLVHDPVFLVFGPDESFAHSLPLVAREFEERTLKYWKQWGGNLQLPVDYQEILLRACISIQLLHSDELGGFVSSLTLGVSEGRVFDIPEICFGISVLREFGFYIQIRKFFDFLKSIVFLSDNPQSVYDVCSIVSGVDVSSLAGLRGPVGAGPARPDPAMPCIIIVGLSQGFTDIRLKDVCSVKLFEKLEAWGEEALTNFGTFFISAALSSMGDEEIGGVSTMGSILIWAAADRLGRVAAHCHWVEKAKIWQAHAERMRRDILANQSGPFLASRWGGSSTCVALLRVAELGFVDTCDVIWQNTLARLRPGEWTTCTLLWYLEALRSIDVERSRSLFHALCASSTECGLFSETIDLETATLGGNLPHCAALVGVLRTGSRFSRGWRQI